MKRKSFLVATLATLLSFYTNIATAQDKIFRVGVTPGPHAQIMEIVKGLVVKEGIQIEVIEFSNFMTPNQALASGELDANSFQHRPYLNNQVQMQGYKIEAVEQTVLFPMGLYSLKAKSLSEIKMGARIGIPNDPTNGGRALLLLQDLGLIKIDPDAGLLAMSTDIIENPKKIQIVELDAAQLPHSLQDLDAGVVNTNYAIPAGLDPQKDPIFMESAQSPYNCVFVVRSGDKNTPGVQIILRAYRSEEVKQYIAQTFGNSVKPLW